MSYVSDIQVAGPDQVPAYVKELLQRYENIETVTISDLAKLHADFEKIHPFQDGNLWKAYDKFPYGKQNIMESITHFSLFLKVFLNFTFHKLSIVPVLSVF